MMDRLSALGPALILALVALARPEAMAEPAAGAPRIVLPASRSDAPGPTAESVEAARAAYELASDRYASGDLEGALQAADAAYAALPNASTALIRAAILTQMKSHEEAFGAYLTTLASEPTAEEARQAAAGIAEEGPACAAQLGVLRLTVTPREATVAVDGKMIGAARYVGVTAGPHQISVSAAGYNTTELTVVADAGAISQAAVALAANVGDEPVAVPAVTSLSGPPEVGTPVIPWVLIGGGAAVALGGLGLNIWALDTASERDSYAQPASGQSEEERRELYEAAHSRAEDEATAAYILYGVGGASIVAGVVLLLLPDEDLVPPVTLAPVGHPDGGGIAVGGTW